MNDIARIFFYRLVAAASTTTMLADFGVRASANAEALWWGGFGLVFGALAGAAGVNIDWGGSSVASPRLRQPGRRAGPRAGSRPAQGSSWATRGPLVSSDVAGNNA